MNDDNEENINEVSPLSSPAKKRISLASGSGPSEAVSLPNDVYSASFCDAPQKFADLLLVSELNRHKILSSAPSKLSPGLPRQDGTMGYRYFLGEQPATLKSPKMHL